MTGVDAAVAILRAQADHRLAWPDCVCREGGRAGRTPRDLEGHLRNCHERIMIERMRQAADEALEEVSRLRAGFQAGGAAA